MKSFVGLAAFVLLTSLPALAFAQGWQQQPAQPGQPPPAGQPPPPDQSGMSAGGLAPPSSSGTNNGYYGDPSAPVTPTEQELQRADREDTGRGLEFFWLNAEIGGEHLGLQTFKANNLVDAGTVKTTQTGLMYGAGLGLRLVFITLGARFRLGHFDEYDLWTLNGELGIRIPIGDVEPYFTLGGGYASMGSFKSSDLSGSLQSKDVDVKGYDVRGGFGIDLYLSNTFSIGANLTGEMLVLTRPGVDPAKLSTATASEQEVYKADGSSIGAAVSLTGVVGLHF